VKSNINESPNSSVQGKTVKRIEKDKKKQEEEEEENNSGFKTGRWTKSEHLKFLEAIELFGRDWKKVQSHVGTRSSTQSRSHAQKFFK